jgi:Na+/H+-dicarboxylate symporter
MKLHRQIFLALILGTATGSLFPHAVPYIDWLGILFMNALCMLIVPILFFSISNSLIQVKQNGALGKLGIKTFVCYVLTMLIAIVTGLALVNVIQPGNPVSVTSATALSFNPGQSTSVKDIVVHFIPPNIVGAFAENNTIPVIILAFLVGLAIPRISEKAQKTLGDFISAGLELTLRITGIIIRFSPIGIFAIVARQFAQTADFWSLLQTMFLYVLTVSIGLALHTFVWLPLILRFGYKVNAWQHFRNMSTPLLTGFSTASSGATLPFTLHAVEHEDGVSSRITNFTIPLGSAINMDGTALLECVAVIFIAQAYGIDLPVVQQMLVAGVSLLCAIGSAGVPMAALVMMVLILNVTGLPVEGIGLVVGVDRILDMMRTAVNIYGDTCVAVIVAKSEGEKLAIDIHSISKNNSREDKNYPPESKFNGRES